MIVRLDDIPPEGLDVTVPLAPGALGPDGVKLEGRAAGEFHLVRHGAGVLVKGRVRGRLATACSRCLEETRSEVDEPVEVEFRPPTPLGKGTHPEQELNPGDLDVEFYAGDSIDLGGFVAQQLRVALPMKPLCSPECLGLCPVCGKPRRDKCGCAEPPGDDRWDALRGLLKK